MSTFRRLLSYMLKEKKLIFISFFSTLLCDITYLLTPFFIGKAIDSFGIGVGEVDFEKVVLFFCLSILMFALAALTRFITIRTNIRISQKFTIKMRTSLFDKLADLKLSFHDNNKIGDLVNRVTYDVNTAKNSLVDDLSNIITVVLTLIISVVMMVSISIELVMVILVTLPLSMLYTRFITKRSKPLYKKRSQMLGKLNAYAEEVITAKEIVSVYNREEYAFKRFSEINDEAFEHIFKSDVYSSTIGPAINAINNLTIMLISTVGSILFLNGTITVGQIASFILYAKNFSGPINMLAEVIGSFQSSLAASERIFEILDTEDEYNDDGSLEFSIGDGRIEFQNVSFGYTKEKPTIENLSLVAEKGQTVAIVGATGAGKTTIINLLMRFYEIDDGSILIDGNNIANLPKEKLRQSFSMVLQDTWLFSGTVAENISYSKPDASMEEIERAAKNAQIHHYIKSLPNGYHTFFDESGLNISSGQKQLLTIARAMLSDAKVLILDEATSNVDTKTEVEIQKAMRKLMKNKTTFVIAHRLSTIKNADQILVIDAGRVVQKGNHDELISVDGLYKEMYNAN